MFFMESGPSPAYPTLAASGDYSDIAVLYNPVSKRSGEIDDMLRILEAGQSEHGLEVHKLATSRDPAENAANLRELPASSLIGIWSGDGGTSKVLRAAHDLQLSNPILIMPGGTKNDLALQTASRKSFTDPTNLLRQAHLGPLVPVELTIQPTGSSEPVQLHKVFAYASQGISGDVAHTVNTPEYRAGATQHSKAATYLTERRIAAQAFMHAKPFTTSSERGTRRSIDLIVANGSRMAGGSIKPAADLFLPEARLITVRNRLVGVGVLCAMGIGGSPSRLVGEPFDIGTPQTIDVSNEQPLYFQVDGDEFSLAGTATLHFQVATRGLNVVTNRQR